ncbi:MAG: hypothetical protein KIT76_12735 [Pseudolabrys sp.]|nr:hypothetical protein [Pseudolabrys sp.]
MGATDMSAGASKIARGDVARAALGGVFAGLILVCAAVAEAQSPTPPAAGPPPPSPQEPGVLESIGRWLDRQSDNLAASFKDAGKGVQNFGREAGVAAQTTVEGAKDAAGNVVRIPAARIVTGHEICKVAPNGAPDCVAAATAMCKARGFASGSSADMTTADVCPAKVYLSGRSTGPECRTETFVSRAFCQ